ncbi:T9SS type A sorting domain-containing protein, partial [Bacteroidota bacterium]
NNFGPTNVIIQECYLNFNQQTNLVSNIQSDITAHNNAWPSVLGPIVYDTLKNSSGEIFCHTWIKNLWDYSGNRGFQSDSIIWFDTLSGNLQPALDAIPAYWTLYVPNRNYTGNYEVRNSFYLKPEKNVHISNLHILNTSSVILIDNDLYISDSLILHNGSYFYTGLQAVELADTARIIEPEYNVLQGVVRTYQNLAGNPDTNDFCGLGMTLIASISQPFPANNVILIRTTGIENKYSSKQLLRSYDVFAHRSCGWDAELIFKYDSSEKAMIQNDSNLKLIKSYDDGIKWLLPGGIMNTLAHNCILSNVGNIGGLWSFADSTGAVTSADIFLNSDIMDVSCYGGKDGEIKLTVSGGKEPYSLNWSTSDTLNNVDSLASGFYWVYATDSFGCSIADTIFVDQPDPIVVGKLIKDVKCYGNSNGQAQLTVTGGIPPYHINWWNGDTSSVLKNVKAGFYSFLCTDKNGCAQEDSVEIGSPSEIRLGFAVLPPSCFGFSNGKITTNISGGTPPYSIFWNHGGSDTILQNLKSGTFYLSMIDSQSCMHSDSVFLPQPAILSFSRSVENLKCFGDNNGKISLQAIGGTPPYTVIWNDFDTQLVRNDLVAGMFSFTIRDSNLCSIKDSSELVQPDKLSMQFILINDTNNKAIGSAEALVQGGILPYSYLWDDFASQKTAKATGLSAGIYTLVVSDSNLCKADSSVEIVNIKNDAIEKNELNYLRLYPNPCKSWFEISSQFKVDFIQMFSPDGKMIEEFRPASNMFRIDTKDYRPGVYILQLFCNNKLYNVRLLKVNN